MLIHVVSKLSKEAACWLCGDVFCVQINMHTQTSGETPELQKLKAPEIK